MKNYKFYQYVKKGIPTIVAKSTFAGKPVKGTAKCDPADTFSEEKGKQLAMARCDVKVSRKRRAHALKRYQEAEQKYKDAMAYYAKMESYYNDAYDSYCQSVNNLESLLTDFEQMDK